MDETARHLPAPPPPRPSQRAAAIAAALERFDGGDGSVTPGRRALSRSAAGWWRTGRVQVGAFASIALVALVAVPLALHHPDTPVGQDETPPARLAVPASGQPPPSEKAAPRIAPAALPAPRSPAARSTQEAPSPPAVADVVTNAEHAAPAQTAPAPPPPPPAAAAPVAMPAEALAADASGAVDRADDTANIIVTGSRISRRAAAAARRGDWNACTVDDPAQSLRSCSRPNRSRARNDAAADVADGVALAWRGEWDDAVAAFGRAIDRQPTLGAAYLNRGLAYQRLGDGDRALADLDRAVRYERSARAYYSRARLRNGRDDRRGARADEDRAIDLNPAYAELFDD